MFFVDLPPFGGVGTSGGGIRAWSLYQGLSEKGFDVTISLPTHTYLAKKYWDIIPSEYKRNSWTKEKQNKIIEKNKPDIVIFSSNWGIQDINLNTKSIPMVQDLHGPTLLESFFSRNKIRPEDIAQKILRLKRSDFYIFVNQIQKRYFSSWILQGGKFLTPTNHGIIPVSYDPCLPDIRNKKMDNVHVGPIFVFSGGFYPWHNPINGIKILSDVLIQKKRGKLWLFTESHKINQQEEQRFENLLDKLKSNPFVHFRGILPRDQLIQEYSNASVALDLMSWNMERELAFTTRKVEYLWAGLPVIYNNYNELGKLIRRYKAGWCIDPENIEEIYSTINQIFDCPEDLITFNYNAQKLVRDNFTWDNTIDPLVKFCQDPFKTVD